MEQQNAFGSGVAPKGKKNLVIMVVLGVLAVGGVGFGIFGMVRSAGLDGEVANLRTEIDKKDEAIKKVEESLGVEIKEKIEVAEPEKVTEVVEVATKSSPDYIYVGQWGIKIKVPSDFTLNYRFDGVRSNPTICVTGDRAGAQYQATYANLSVYEHGVGCLARVKTGSDFWGTTVYSDGTYDYRYYSPQASMSESWEQENEQAVYEIVKKMLTEGVSGF